jgi:hypothetical protein
MLIRDCWRRLHPAARGLALFAAANILVLHLALPLVTGTSLRLTGLADAGRILCLQKVKDADSWRPMIRAVGRLRGQPGQLLYAALFFEQQTKFQYPPTSLLVTYPALAEGVTAALGRVNLDWIGVLTAVSWVLVFLTAGMAAAILRRGLGGPGREPLAARDAVVVTAAGLVLGLTFYPVGRAYSLGQIQVWVNALFAALAWCWIANQKGTAGVLAGTMCLIKPQYAILLLWGTLRGQGRFVLAAVLTGLAGLAVSVWQFGLANHLDYLRVLSFLARHGESFYPNQSVNGLLNRMLFNGNNLVWDEHGFPPFHPVVWAGTMAASVTLLGLALYPPRHRQARGSALDLGVAALTCTLASPVAWEHHYGVLLPVYALLFGVLYQHGGIRWGLGVLAVSYALTGNFLLVLNCFADTPFNFLQSYALVGGLLALGLAYRWRGFEPDFKRAAGWEWQRAAPSGSAG